MPLDFSALKDQPRLLIEVPLKPIQGSRFQPTGFPDLGAATFTGVRYNENGEAEEYEALLVESAQSMANRLEEVCWDEAADNLIEELQGLPYVASTLKDGTRTNSILEGHRINSPYIYESKEFERIKQEIGFEKDKPFNRSRLIKALLKYDICSLLHGIFLVKVGGTVRLPRLISAFIEAEEVFEATSGGAKIDRVQPETSGEKTTYGNAKDGYGNIPFHRVEYSAEKITAFFNLDLTQLRGYGLGEEVENLLIALSLFKIQKFLKEGLRLRTACDLEPISGLIVKRPEGYDVPDLATLSQELPGLIQSCSDHFASPPVTEVHYKK